MNTRCANHGAQPVAAATRVTPIGTVMSSAGTESISRPRAVMTSVAACRPAMVSVNSCFIASRFGVSEPSATFARSLSISAMFSCSEASFFVDTGSSPRSSCQASFIHPIFAVSVAPTAVRASPFRSASAHALLIRISSVSEKRLRNSRICRRRCISEV